MYIHIIHISILYTYYRYTLCVCIYILYTYNKASLQFLKILTAMLRWSILTGVQKVLLRFHVFCTLYLIANPLQAIHFLMTHHKHPSLSHGSSLVAWTPSLICIPGIAAYFEFKGNISSVASRRPWLILELTVCNSR